MGSPASSKIQGVIASETKTTYIDNGTSYTFNWKAGDYIAVQVIGDGVSQNGYNQLRYSADNGDVSATSFTATTVSGWNEGDYAFYPKSQGDYAENYGINRYHNELAYLHTALESLNESEAIASTTATVKNYETIDEVANLPMAHIPMIGYKTGEHEFSFKAPMGVLAITINGIPSAAKSITISSADYAMNGLFVFDNNCEIKELYCKDAVKNTTKTIVFPANGATNRTFYFPLPTGQMNGIAITLKDMGGQTIFTKASAKTIDIIRATVTELPVLTFTPAVAWYNLGDGQYKDGYIIDDVFYQAQLASDDSYYSDNITGPITTAFQQSSSNSNLYRISNPYTIAASERHYYQTQTSGREIDLINDPYLYIQVLSAGDALPYGDLKASNDGEVWFGSGSTTEAVGNGNTKGVFSTGLYIDWGAVKGHTESAQYGEFVIKHEDWHSASTQYRYSKVLSTQVNTEFPDAVQIAPYYQTRKVNTYENFSVRNGYNQESYELANVSIIRVIFPER